MEFRSLRRRSQNYPGDRLWPSRWFIFPPAYREKAKLALARDGGHGLCRNVVALCNIVYEKDPANGTPGGPRAAAPFFVDPSTRRENGPTAWLWNFFNYITTFSRRKFSRVSRSCPCKFEVITRRRIWMPKDPYRNRKSLRKLNKRWKVDWIIINSGDEVLILITEIEHFLERCDEDTSPFWI